MGKQMGKTVSIHGKMAYSEPLQFATERSDVSSTSSPPRSHWMYVLSSRMILIKSTIQPSEPRWKIFSRGSSLPGSSKPLHSPIIGPRNTSTAPRAVNCQTVWSQTKVSWPDTSLQVILVRIVKLINIAFFEFSVDELDANTCSITSMDISGGCLDFYDLLGDHSFPAH